VALIVTRLRRRYEYIPFGPFMVVCAFAVMLYPTIGQVALRAWQAWLGTWSG